MKTESLISKRLREFDRLCKTNHLFVEFKELVPDLNIKQTLAAWSWVQRLIEKAIHRTIKDLTQPPPFPTLERYRRND